MAVSSCGAGRASPLHGCRMVLEASYSIIQVDVSPRAARRLVEADRAPTLAYSTRPSRSVSPSRTLRNSFASPSTRPRRFTGLAALGVAPELAGVGPKKMQKALPGG